MPPETNTPEQHDELLKGIDGLLSKRDATLVSELDTKLAKAQTDARQEVARLAEEHKASLTDLEKMLQASSLDLTDEQAAKVKDIVAERIQAIRTQAKESSGSDKEETADKALDFNFARAAEGSMVDWKGTAKQLPEYKATMEATEKAVQADVDVQGGFAVPAAYMANRLIPALEARTVSLQLGATVIDSLDGAPGEIPRITNVPDAEWVGEVQESSDTDVKFGMLRLNPHGLVSYIPVSRRFLRMSALSSGQSLIEQHMARALSRKADLAALKGDGASGQPRGMYNTTGIGEVDWNSADFAGADQNVSDLADQMIGKLEDNDAYGGRLGWAMSPAVRRKLRTTKDADGRPLFFSTMGMRDAAGGNRTIGAIAGEFYDFPYATTTQLAGGDPGDLILADWETLIFGYFEQLVFDVSEHVLFKKRQLALRAYMEVDMGVQHPEAIAIANNLDATGV